MARKKVGRQPTLGLAVLLVAALPGMCAWKLAGPFGGSARAIAIDPRNGATLIAGSRDSLLVRSDDAGASWRLLPFPRGTPGVFNSVLVHPRESGHFYAGLDAGESPDSGVWESTDGGEHWQVMGGTRGSRIESLAISPADARVIAAGTSKGVFLTADAGTTWIRISSATDPEMQDITALAFDPTDTRTLYAGTPHLPWKTTDGGTTWHSISTGLIDDSDIFSIRVDPARPQLLFASACSGIYRSDNAGGTWLKIHGIPGTHRRTHIIAEDPRNSDTIYAGTTLGLFKSPDGGKTWRHLSFEQVNWMVFDPSEPRTLYLATEYAGILKSLDSGETFRTVNVGFSNHRLSQLTSDGKRLYASSTYEGLFGGVFVSEDGGLAWSLRANEEALLGRNLHSLTALPGSGAAVFGASEDAILKSADAGKTWSAVTTPHILSKTGQPLARAGHMRIHALRAASMGSGKPVLFAGTDAGLFRSTNQGTTWEQVKAAGITGIPVLAVEAPLVDTPSNGASRLAVRTNSGLFISVDSGGTWQPAMLPDNSYYLYELALPVDRNAAILAATSRGLLRSTDEGAHWDLVTKGVPAATVDSVRFTPWQEGAAQNQEAFLVQFGAVYRSVDGGESWESLSAVGLSDTAIRELWFAPDLPRRIFALTSARGALVFDLPPAEVAKQGAQAVISSRK